ncbi:MAG: hypothetical protein IPG17_25395 [Sandaracinaceae bacterium]|nr:hypothetical protein [Sandaracinaceae bacterium]
MRLGLAHKDIAHELVPIALMTGEQRAPEHRARNPIGQVPVLELLGREPVLLVQLWPSSGTSKRCSQSPRPAA